MVPLSNISLFVHYFSYTNADCHTHRKHTYKHPFISKRGHCASIILSCAFADIYLAILSFHSPFGDGGSVISHRVPSLSLCLSDMK